MLRGTEVHVANMQLRPSLLALLRVRASYFFRVACAAPPPPPSEQQDTSLYMVLAYLPTVWLARLTTIVVSLLIARFVLKVMPGSF